jgi:DNA-binding transcriptional MerR regulator
MAQYSIKDIEILTGVKAHTIRIWEQRYNIVEPHRTDTNIRYYDQEQLKLLLNVSMLLKNGKKISHVAKMDKVQLNQEILSLVNIPVDKDGFLDIQIDNLIVSMIELDELKFEKIISNSTIRLGFENVMTKIIIPFLHKVGLLWTTGEINVAQEHFISNLIRRKLIVAIDGQSHNFNEKKSFLLFLPEGELHEMGLLFAKFLIKSRGFKTVYLGQSVPMDDIIKLKETYSPDYILTYFTLTYDYEQMIEYVNHLFSNFSPNQIILCGPQASSLKSKIPAGAKIMLQIDELINFLQGL